ncbi:MAG: fasciclin domain-containing protein [Alphaproteobacteria bacterium]
MRNTRYLLATAAVLALPFNGAWAAGESAQAVEPCIVAGKEMPRASDGNCHADVLSTLRAYSFDYSVERRDENGDVVIDEKTGKPALEQRTETFALMASLLEEAGFGEVLTAGEATVFAVPDSVLSGLVDDWRSALQDEKRRPDAVRVIGVHAVDEPLRRSWFSAANGKVWTLAGDWRSGAAPIAFHDLTRGRPLRLNGVPVGIADIHASTGVIHVVEPPLAVLPAPPVAVAEKP